MNTGSLTKLLTSLQCKYTYAICIQKLIELTDLFIQKFKSKKKNKLIKI